MPQPKPICFMVMPYGVKDTGVPTGKGPATVDFDALWLKAFEPLIRELGYEPVRADQDSGALIIHEMLERLYFSDLVIADMSIPNGNVYYEVGVRHAARERGCVLISADWSRPLFDLDQVSRIPYPLPDGEIADQTAETIISRLRSAIPHLAAGVSPMVQVLPGFPGQVDPNRASTIRDFLHKMAQFQARIHSVKLSPEFERESRVEALLKEFPPSSTRIVAMAMDMVDMVKDSVKNSNDWEMVLDYIDALPTEIKDIPEIQEQRCLALSKTGNHIKAIEALEELIKMKGATSEREGLIGGRYKKLYSEALNPKEKAQYLNEAIKHYKQGMMLDLNDYFPSCNLPRLYRNRAEQGDEREAHAVAQLVMLACRRAMERNPKDEWVRPTLLGMAFDDGDIDAARNLVGEIKKEVAAQWKIDTTISDLETSVALINDAEKRKEFDSLTAQLRALL